MSVLPMVKPIDMAYPKEYPMRRFTDKELILIDSELQHSLDDLEESYADPLAEEDDKAMYQEIMGEITAVKDKIRTMLGYET